MPHKKNAVEHILHNTSHLGVWTSEVAASLFQTRLPTNRALTLPDVRVSMRELAAAVDREAGCSQDFVKYAPDETLEAAFGRRPQHAPSRAVELGFADDGSLDPLFANAFSCA